MKVEFQGTKKNEITLGELAYGTVFRVKGESLSALFVKTEYTGDDDIFTDRLNILNDYVHTGANFDTIDYINMICCVLVRDMYIRFMNKDTLVEPFEATLVVKPQD